MELNEKELENVIAGSGLNYEESKEFHKNVFNKFKPATKDEEKAKENELSELSEEDLEKYMGGIRIEEEEYDSFTR